MRISRFLACLLVFLATGFSLRAAEKTDETPFEYQPYRVRIAVAFSRDYQMTSRFRRQVLENLKSAITRSAAVQWELTVEETNQIAPASRLGLERLKAEDFQQEKPAEGQPAPPAEFDKQIFLTVSAVNSRFSMAGREWDELTQEVSAVEESITYHPRGVAEELCQLVSKLFHPLLSVEQVDIAAKTISLTLQAGGFVPTEVSADDNTELLRRQVRPGTILIAFFRYHDKDGSLRQVQFIPWTYLVVEKVIRGRVTASLVTGIRPPLGAKTSKRVKSLAVVRKVRHPSTSLQIQLRKNPRKKLAGHYISATAEKYPDEENQSPELFRLTTDRLGRVEIPVTPDHDILWLRVHSGNLLLSLVPFAPGLDREILLDLPDDSVRLRVEGDLTQIRAELVDTVARRAALMVRARKAVEKKDWKTVDEEMDKLDKLPSLAEFRDKISDVRTYATNEEYNDINPLIKSRVRKMCETADELVKKYLSEERINQLKEEIRESRKG